MYSTGWRKPIGCLIYIDRFPQKSPMISGSVAKRDLQLMHVCHPVLHGRNDFLWCVNIHRCVRLSESHMYSTGWRKPIGYLIFTDRFPQKSPMISGSVAKRDLQLMHVCHPVLHGRNDFLGSVNIQSCVKLSESHMYSTGWRKPIGCLIFIDRFPQKSPMISGSFAQRDLQLMHVCHPVLHGRNDFLWCVNIHRCVKLSESHMYFTAW